MFVNKEHLPQVLTSDDYKCPKHFEREMETMFLPSWQIVATKSNLPNDGDFQTLGGLVFETLGRVPEEGDHFQLAGTEFTVLEVVDHAIRRLRIDLKRQNQPAAQT
jgi:CBS domain containing-hemolysin-like protein